MGRGKVVGNGDVKNNVNGEAKNNINDESKNNGP